MIAIKNNLIPFPGYAAITIWPFVFIRRKSYDRMTERQRKVMMNHESIHGRQQLEMLLIPFYILYGIEYLIKKTVTGDPHYAYRNISFEKEAYANEEDFEYLKGRKFWQLFRKK